MKFRTGHEWGGLEDIHNTYCNIHVHKEPIKSGPDTPKRKISKDTNCDVAEKLTENNPAITLEVQ